MKGLVSQVVPLAFLVAAACAAAPAMAKRSARAAATAPKAEVSLPEWAPKSPSQEFLRAAKVLKPLPMDAVLTGRDTMARPAEQHVWFAHVFPRTWEFFGTLSDEQVRQFREKGSVLISTRRMSAPQTAAFRSMLADFRGLKYAEQDMDLEVGLYKMGARADLSNVEAGFSSYGEKGKTHVAIFVVRVAPSKPGEPHGTQGIGPIAQF